MVDIEMAIAIGDNVCIFIGDAKMDRHPGIKLIGKTKCDHCRYRREFQFVKNNYKDPFTKRSCKIKKFWVFLEDTRETPNICTAMEVTQLRRTRSYIV